MQTVGGREPLRGELGRLYDAIENPRTTADELPILRGDELRSYLEEVRERALEVLDGIELESAEDPLLAGGFVYEMLLAHEHQHNETMLQLLQMVEGYEPVEVIEPPAPEPAASDGPEMVLVEGGAVEIGAGPTASRTTTSARATRSSSSRSGSTALPVTNRAYAEFVSRHRRRAADVLGARRRGLVGAHRDGPPRAGRSRRAGDPRLLARGRRLRALGRASACPPSRSGRRPPRGADPRARQPRPARLRLRAARGAYADAPSDCGARPDARRRLGVDVLGLHSPIPASRPSPTREYSEVFFGDTYKVLRGGAWATRRNVIRTSFRNWDLPRAPPDLRRHPLRQGRLNRDATRRGRRVESVMTPQRAPTRSRSTCTCPRAGRCPGWPPTSAPG